MTEGYIIQFYHPIEADLLEDIREDWMQWHHEELIRDNKVFETVQLKLDIQMKIVEPEEFYKRTGVDLVTIGAFKRTTRGDYMIFLNAGKKYDCGCKKKHIFSSDYTKIHWHEKGLVNIDKLILQQPGCNFVNFIELGIGP